MPEGAGPCGWYLHEEGHQLNEGLFLGAGCKLGDHLDDFVHDAAQVALELLPSFLHKLGILSRQIDRQVRSRVLPPPIQECPCRVREDSIVTSRQLTLTE